MVVYLAIGLTDITNKIADAENAAISNPEVWTEAYKTSYIEEILTGATDGMTFALRAVMAFLPIIFMGIGVLITMKKSLRVEIMQRSIFQSIPNWPLR